MSIIEDLKKIDAHYFGAVTLIFSAVVSPGFLIIYLFRQDLFLSLPAIKLIIFSASLALPVAILNTFFAAYFVLKKDGEGKVDVLQAILESAVMSFITLYLALLISYLFPLKFREFIYVLIGLELIFLIIQYFTSKKPVEKAKA